MSSAPGKRVAGRDGINYERSVREDIAYLQRRFGISLVICLLNSAELSHIGVLLKDYQDACSDCSVELIQHPIVEMAPIDPLQARKLCTAVVAHLQAGPKHHALFHCRGGMGRTGTLAACMLLQEGVATTANGAIVHVRQQRSQRAVESRKQEDCIRAFQVMLDSERSVAG